MVHNIQHAPIYSPKKLKYYKYIKIEKSLKNNYEQMYDKWTNKHRCNISNRKNSTNSRHTNSLQPQWRSATNNGQHKALYK